MQDEIVARLARALNAELVAVEARRSEQVPNPDSMDLYFQGMASFHRAPSPDALRQGQSFFERALALDPGIIEARVGLGAGSLRSRHFWRSRTGRPGSRRPSPSSSKSCRLRRIT